jgi:hypothetical protein
MAVGDKYQRGEMALRVLHSLPAQHEKYFYQEIRRRCMNQMAVCVSTFRYFRYFKIIYF